MKKFVKNQVESVLGSEVVDEAESFYETDFDKCFWLDLSDNEIREYLARAMIKLGIPLERLSEL